MEKQNDVKKLSCFIINKGEESLSKTINGIMPKTEALDFLVGYFYFSGIKEIYKNLEGRKVNILVGLELDSNLMEKTAEIDFLAKEAGFSILNERNNFFSSFVDICGKTDFFEGINKEAFKIYYEKIKDGTLEIRKTKEPNHAKMYIFSYNSFHNEDGGDSGCVITGSSNLTCNGLRRQNEINVRLKNKFEYEEAKYIFDKLWKENSIPIVNKDNINLFEEKVMKRIWIGNIPSPYLFYLRALHEYFNINITKKIQTPKEITRNQDMKDLKYQTDAIEMALDKIDKYNGVIISDVAGLGKSIVGSAVAYNLGLRTIIIAPPHLKEEWENYALEFRIKEAKVFSRGAIKEALKFYRENAEKFPDEKWLVIIDEAHYYRNEYTQDYPKIHELCQDNKIMLLTATPFNNQPSDIYSMIRLFQVNPEKEFPKLIDAYKELRKNIKKNGNNKANEAEKERIGTRIRKIIRPLCIRRSRIDLEKIPEYKNDLIKNNMDFPKVNPPEELEYNLGDLTELYQSTLNEISDKKSKRYNPENITTDENFTEEEINEEELTDKVKKNIFKATRYKPILYVRTESREKLKEEIENAGFNYNLFQTSQSNMAKFMRTLLVHRFESSQAAFKKSLNNMLKCCKNVKNWIEIRGKVPIYKKGMLLDIKELYESTYDKSTDEERDIEMAIEKLNDKELFEIEAKYLSDDFFNDLDSDIIILSKLKEKWDRIDENNDPKYIAFKKIIKEKLKKDPDRKIVVFSQFADTVEYLEKKFNEANFSIFAYTAKKSNEKNRKQIKKNFDAGVESAEQEDKYKILIATDAISEGYNLHRAGTIFNYDIPYNPTRVIQRIGRINRVNKKMFKELFIYNYFPGAIGEDETHIKEISTLKMAMIHAIMGEDTKILTKKEKLKSYFAEEQWKLIKSENTESWDAAYRTEYDEVKDSKDMEEALKLPLRSRVRREMPSNKEMPNGGVLVFAKKDNDLLFKKADYGDENIEPQNIETEDALAILKFNKEKEFYKGKEVSEQFENTFDKIKESLFVKDSEGDRRKNSKYNALRKIDVIIKSKDVNEEYLEFLKEAIKRNAIPDFYLREINRLKSNEYKKLPSEISEFYIKKAMNQYASTKRGVDMLIFAEEIGNV